MTLEEFKEKANKKHVGKYDYSKVSFDKLTDYVTIICPIHGEFRQKAANHLKYGCKKCASEMKSKKFSSTKEEFIEKAKKLYGDRYDYSKVVYVKNSVKVIIVCPKHGEFLMRPNDFLDGHICPKCAKENMKEKMRFSNEDFVNKAKKVHGDKYIYSKVDYKTTDDKVCIICPEHGEFYQTPHAHLRGQGCPKCGYKIINNNKKLKKEDFIKRASMIHNGKYDYSKIKYNIVNDKVCIICPEHGEFWQKACDHLNGRGCDKCGGTYRLTTDEFISRSREVHGDKYDYSKTNYVNNREKVCIICPEHGEFLQQPSHHMNGHGCPKCFKSSLEDDIIELLEKNGIDYKYNRRYNFLDNLQLDFYIPELKIAIECQGAQHFTPVEGWGGIKQFENIVHNDNKKYLLCEKEGIKLLYYSNLGIKYPYNVIEDKQEILNIIVNERDSRNI